MKFINDYGDDEKGSAIMIAVVVLLALTLSVTIASKKSFYELRLSGNDKFIKQMKIDAESAVAVAAQLVELQPLTNLRDSDWSSSTRMPWFSRGPDMFDDKPGVETTSFKEKEEYTQNYSNWVSDDQGGTEITNSSEILDPDENLVQGFEHCEFQVIDVKIADGNTLKIGNLNTNLHDLFISGVSREAGGRCMVQVGYRKRF